MYSLVSVTVIAFKRCPERFRLAVQESDTFMPLRMSMETSGCNHLLSNGGKVLLPPVYYHRVMYYLTVNGAVINDKRLYLSDLKAWHLVILSCDENLFLDTMKQTACKGSKVAYIKGLARFLLIVPGGLKSPEMMIPDQPK